MNKTIRRLQGMIFVGWAFFLVQKIESGEILYYINQRYILLVFLGALAFLGLGLATLVSAQKSAVVSPPAHDHADPGAVENEPAHKHPAASGAIPPWGTLVLALPLLLGLVIPSRPLGSSAMSNRGVNSAAPLIRKPGGAAVTLTQSTTDRSVLDWVGLFSAASDPAIYQGQAAQVTGFVFHDPRISKGQFFVSRFVITCCVADASALGILVDWSGAEKLPENGWVQVKGSIYTAAVSGQVLPGIHAQAVETIPTPDQPYLFP